METDRINIGQTLGVDPDMITIKEMANLEVTQGTIKIFERQKIRREYRNSCRDDNCARNRGRSRSSNQRNDRNMSNSRSRAGSRASTNRDRIRYYKCREYDHSVRNCRSQKRRSTYTQGITKRDREILEKYIDPKFWL